MANIRELAAPNDLGLRPDSRADESLANSGRRVAALYGQAAEANADTGRRVASAVMDVGNVAQKAIEHHEISAGAAESAKTLSGLDALWNKTVKDADPNDPTTAAKFREEVVEPTLEKLRDGFMTEGGTRFAEATVERFRNHFVSKTTADMSTLAGIAAKKNVETLTNQYSNAAIRDPSSLKTSLEMVERSVGAMVDSSPNMDGVTAARVKMDLTLDAQKAIVKAAAIGAIAANPDAGLKEFSSEKYSKYISGAELRQLEQQSKAVIRAERVDENYRRQNKEREETEKSDAREGEYLVKLHSGDPKEMAQVSAKAIANDFTLTRSARERMIGIVERETKPETAAKVSNQTAIDLISRIRAPSGDPNRIDSLNAVYDAYEKGKLSKADFKFVQDEFVNLRTPEGQRLGTQQEEFIKSVKGQITHANPLIGKTDPVGDQKVYEFTVALRDKIEEYRKTGKNPRDLMDPSKPDYMGSPAALAGYQKSLADSVRDTATRMRPAPPRNDVMPAIPPVANRLPGSTYDTPKGPKKWTGTGWIDP